VIKPPRAHKFLKNNEVRDLFLAPQLVERNRRKRKKKIIRSKDLAGSLRGSQSLRAFVARPLAKLPGTFNVPMPDAKNPERHFDHLCSWKYAQVCLEQAPKLYLLAHRLTGQDAHGREVFSWLASFDEGQDILAELVGSRIEHGVPYSYFLMNKWQVEITASSRVELSKKSIANSRFVMRTDVHMGHTYERRSL